MRAIVRCKKTECPMMGTGSKCVLYSGEMGQMFAGQALAFVNSEMDIHSLEVNVENCRVKPVEK